MSFMDKAKAAAERAKVKAQEGVGEVQAKKDLAQAYWDLGHKTYELASQGTISNPELEPLIQKISQREGGGGGAAGGAGPEAAAGARAGAGAAGASAGAGASGGAGAAGASAGAGGGSESTAQP